jgi:hypothetical protein
MRNWQGAFNKWREINKRVKETDREEPGGVQVLIEIFFLTSSDWRKKLSVNKI